MRIRVKKTFSFKFNPKKLKENWTIYTINDKRNILSEDRLNYDVLNHTDLTRVSGYSGEINLATLNWSNYDLIVIDESHNFRNTSTNKKKSKSRYATLLDDVLKKGVKTKVLNWPNDYVDMMLNDEFFKDRYIYLEHDGKKYKSIDELFLNVPNTMISKDYEFFGSNPPNDNHPSLLSQKIISDSIIKSINSDKLI